jgi:hypothetical protein
MSHDHVEQRLREKIPNINPIDTFVDNVMKEVRNRQIRRPAQWKQYAYVSGFSVLMLFLAFAYLARPFGASNETDTTSSDVASEKPVILPVEQQPSLVDVESALPEKKQQVELARQKVSTSVASVEKDISAIENDVDFLDSELSDEYLFN